MLAKRLTIALWPGLKPRGQSRRGHVAERPERSGQERSRRPVDRHQGRRRLGARSKVPCPAQTLGSPARASLSPQRQRVSVNEGNLSSRISPPPAPAARPSRLVMCSQPCSTAFSIPMPTALAVVRSSSLSRPSLTCPAVRAPSATGFRFICPASGDQPYHSVMLAGPS